MTISPHRLLEYAVATYDDHDEPLRPAMVAARFDVPTATARAHLDRLVDCAMLAHESEGYRPTVTAREFLALDLDDEFVVVDANEAGER